MLLTDREVIATWMEPKPSLSETFRGDFLSEGGWWVAADHETTWEPISITLNECHLVEQRLTEEQRAAYALQILTDCGFAPPVNWRLLHASAETRIRALSQVLRSEVERG